MNIYLPLLVSVLLLFPINSLNAQNASDDLRLNRSVLKYYSGNSLDDLSQKSSQDYITLKKYFTNSFTVTLVNCSGCIVNIDELFNLDLFNVVNFEPIREQNSEAQLIFKDKYKIVLISKNDLEVLLNGAKAGDMLSLNVTRPLPNFIDTGDNEADYSLYKITLHQWIKDFPEEYRLMTTGNSMLRITLSDYLSLPETRKEAVLSHTDGYIITD